MNESLKIIISAEIDKLKKATLDAKGSLDTLKQKSGISAEKIDENFKKAGEGISSAMKTAGTAIAGAVAALAGVAVATQEYQVNMSKLNTAFTTAGGSAKTAKETYNDLYRVLGDSDVATEAAGHLAKLTTNQKELEQWTTICQGVYATFGDSLPIEGLTEAANETAKTGALTGGLADALNWAGISEEQFQEKLDACNTEAEREKLIRETLNTTYSDAAAAYEKSAADVLAQNEAQAKLTATLANVGAVMTPIITAFISFAADALAVVTPYIQNLGETLLPKLKTLLEGVTTGIQKAFEWASKHKPLLAAIAAAIGVVAAAITAYNVVQKVKALMAAKEVTSVIALTGAYIAQGAAMLVAIAPYVLVVAGITAIIAAIVLCVKHWDKIKAKVKAVWSSIKTATTNAVNAVKEKFSNLKTKTLEKINGLKSSAVEKFQSLKSSISSKVSGIVTSVTTKFDSIKSKIKTKIEGAKDAVKTAIDKIKGFFNFSWSLPKLKMPKISISGKFSINPPQVPKFSIAWNKLGGVFDSPTLFNYGGSLQGLGEDGAEAVVPLEKNTKWLDRLATMLMEKQGGSRPIILQVDGKTFAQVSIDSINQLTKQTGNLGLNIV